ncbi:heat shock 70 family protein [Solirubrobacter ginsenosidimutans]|uniref:Heat shock 70 family protein n=1 Tax=Solirubrobacter ginsenosidimutans TaxID=490573 RepID=A0A9X3MZD6_9ACTN|nr:Hsp70 family protein [Solirubrobacter ginsenosidimutans]MDA0165327.1 heat shock 70 family protein [Solirubrobacter ginsenosidimutans]
MTSTDRFEGRRVLGIDLGTTNSAVAVWDEAAGRVVPLADPDGVVLMPSLVGWDAGRRRWVVGAEAAELADRNPSAVAYSVKRHMGRRFDEPSVMQDSRTVAYRMLPGDADDPLRAIAIDFGEARLTPPDIAAKVLSKLRYTAATALGVPLEGLRKAVITVPAYFNLLQRRATLLAAEFAGLEAEILNEPTAAALTCADLLDENPRLFLIYDLGGGTFDLSLLEAKRDEAGYLFETLTVHGDTRLGGDDIDRAVTDWLLRQSREAAPTPAFREAVRHAAERAKIELSSGETTMALGRRMTRAQLVECSGAVLADTRRLADEAVREISGLEWSNIDDVILVGGQTRMPAVQAQVSELLGATPRLAPEPELAVALGAAEYAHMLSRGRRRFHERALVNVLALPLGIKLDDDRFHVLVEANVTIPHRSKVFPVTTREDNQETVRVEVLQGTRTATRVSECILLGPILMDVEAGRAGTARLNVVFDVHSDGTMTAIVSDPVHERVGRLDVVDSRRLNTFRGQHDKPMGEPHADR